MNDNFMQLSAVEPSFKRLRFLLRPVASTVKQRVTTQGVSPLAQNMSTAQPAFSALVMPSRHIQLLLIHFFFWGLPCSSACACVPFFWVFVTAVPVRCENELLGNSAGWLKVEAWLWDFFELPKAQSAGSLGVLYSFKKKKPKKCLFKQIARQHGSFCF